MKEEAARMRQKAYNYGIEDALEEPEQDEDDGRWDAYVKIQTETDEPGNHCRECGQHAQKCAGAGFL